MGKIYNVVLMSDIGNGAATTGETFFYDWTQLPDVQYKVSFSFQSAIATLTNTTIATIYVDLGQSYNTLAKSQNSNAIQYKSFFLGSLQYSGTGASNGLSAMTITNPLTFLNGRPRNNNFLVEIHQNNANQADYAPPTGAYTLILNFEEI